MATDPYDLLIVGGGMAGASLACALAETGMQIAIIEAVPWQSDEQPSYDVRTISLSHGSRMIYETMGIWEHIDAEAICPIQQIHVSDYGHAGLTHLDRKDAGVEALGYVIENRALGAALMQRLEQQDNVDLVCPAAVTRAATTDDLATLQCSRNDEDITLHGKLLVIADGGRSGLREMLGFESNIDDYQQSAIVCNVSPGLFHQHCAYERFTASGPLAILPMNGDRCWCVWAVAAEDVEDYMALSEEQFLARLQQQFGDRLGRFSRVGKRYVYPLSRSRAEKHYRTRVVLVGNAAQSVHPVAAQGFNLALRDVAWLAEVLAQAHDNNEDHGAEGVLAKYEDIRHRDTRRVTSFTHGMIKLFTSQLPPVIAGRNMGLLAVDLLPEVKRALLKRTMGLSGRQSRLARGLLLK